MKNIWLDLAADDLAEIAGETACGNPAAAERILERLWSVPILTTMARSALSLK